ncbi:MAG: hypothetical protein SGJ20_03020 [Planctomycetota bacterium]|nr:hypothetical protein [Planctomycetota bacterium]
MSDTPSPSLESNPIDQPNWFRRHLWNTPERRIATGAIGAYTVITLCACLWSLGEYAFLFGPLVIISIAYPYTVPQQLGGAIVWLVFGRAASTWRMLCFIAACYWVLLPLGLIYGLQPYRLMGTFVLFNGMIAAIPLLMMRLAGWRLVYAADLDLAALIRQLASKDAPAAAQDSGLVHDISNSRRQGSPWQFSLLSLAGWTMNIAIVLALIPWSEIASSASQQPQTLQSFGHALARLLMLWPVSLGFGIVLCVGLRKMFGEDHTAGRWFWPMFAVYCFTAAIVFLFTLSLLDAMFVGGIVTALGTGPSFAFLFGIFQRYYDMGYRFVRLKRGESCG